MINIRLSSYHGVVFAMYLIALPIVYLLFPEIFRYHYLVNQSVILCLFFTLIGLVSYVLWKRKRTETEEVHFGISRILEIIFYSTLFAVPEEILFRGLLQTYLSSIFNSGLFIIIFSSLIFGFAHIFNGSIGLHPKHWNWKLAGIACTGGLPLGYLFLLTGSLLLPTLLHMVYLIALRLFLSQRHDFLK